ncbi:shikimate kinase [bacterium]|nr:MAG: shikimate kinase [bacterium]
MEQSLFLTGFMGAGKSSVGKLLARRLGVKFLDLDAEIERRERRSIKEIFETSGEEGFRKAEAEALGQVLGGPPSVVALGGGTLSRQSNRKALNGKLVVNLSASFEELYRRIRDTGDTRPLVRDGEEALRARFEERKPTYDGVGIQVETGGKTTEEVAAEVLSKILGPCPKEKRCER